MLNVKKNKPIVRPLKSNVPHLFIVGSGRCGTTLLKNILGRHPDIAVLPELEFLKFIMAKRKKYHDLDNPKIKNMVIEMTINKLVETKFPEEMHYIDLDSLENQLYRCRTYRELFLTVSLYSASKQDYKIVVHNDPSDVFYLDHIFSFLPRAKIIHLVRDGREVVASARKRGWGNSNINQVVRWKEALRAYRTGKKKFPDKENHILEYKYENLITKPKLILKEILGFLDINAAPEDFYDFKNFDYFNTSFGKALPNKAESGLHISKNFDSYFTTSEQKTIEGLLQKELKAQEYKLKFFKKEVGLENKLRYLLEIIKHRLFIWFKRRGRFHTYLAIKRRFKKLKS